MTAKWISLSLAMLVFTWVSTEAKAASFDEMATHAGRIVVAVVQNAKVLAEHRAATGSQMDTMGAASGSAVHDNSWVKVRVTNNIAGSGSVGDDMVVCTGEHLAVGNAYLFFVSADKDVVRGCSWSVPFEVREIDGKGRLGVLVDQGSLPFFPRDLTLIEQSIASPDVKIANPSRPGGVVVLRTLAPLDDVVNAIHGVRAKP